MLEAGLINKADPVTWRHVVSALLAVVIFGNTAAMLYLAMFGVAA